MFDIFNTNLKNETQLQMTTRHVKTTIITDLQGCIKNQKYMKIYSGVCIIVKKLRS